MERGGERVIARGEMWSKVEVMQSSPSAWRESEFETWLQAKLAVDREELVGRLQEKVSKYLVDHQKAVLDQVGERLESTFTAACPPPVSMWQCSTKRFEAVPADRNGSKRSSNSLQVPGGALSPKARTSQREAKDSGGAAGSGAAPGAIAVKDQERRPSDESKARGSPRAAAKANAGAQNKGLPRADSKVSTSGQSSNGTTGTVMQYKSDRMKSLHKSQTSVEPFQSPLRQQVKRIVKSTAFEVASTVIILINTMVMAIEVQVVGCKVAGEMQHADCIGGTERNMPGAEETLNVITITFTALFIIEFVLRLVAMGRQAYKCTWMWFDFILITIGSVDAVERLGGSINLAVNPAMMRTVRVFRMLRMAKVLKSRDGFASLFLLFKSIQASVQALFWSVLLLIFLMTCFGMLINQLLHGFMADPTITEDDRREVFEYYGTYTRMLTTMFELTLGNWAPPSRLLMVKVSQWWGLFIVAYRCILCLCLVNVSSAVFIAETNRAAASDDEVMMMRKRKEQAAATKKLQDLFMDLDSSGDGYVTYQEFEMMLADDIMKSFLSTLEVEATDLEELFQLLDDGDGQVESHEFVRGINMMRGQAKSIDLLTLLKITRRMNYTVERIQREVFPGASSGVLSSLPLCPLSPLK